jgi:diguanylate cyclase (GGDEF)-like protein/PAS domain S-box-containing protein
MLSWFVTVTLGMLIVAPLVLIGLASLDPDAQVIPDRTSRTSVAGLLALVAVVAVGVFAQDRYPLLFLPLVALMVATWRLGPLGAVAGVGIVALIAPSLTAIGHGSLQLRGGSAAEASFFLQFYLLTLFATALPFGALLAQQRRLAAERAESERMHRLLADSSTDIILRLSLEGVALYCSPAVDAVLGFTPEQTVGHVLIGFVHPDDRAIVEAGWNRALVSSAPETLMFRHARADGGHAWLEVAYRRVAVDGGEEVVARARDITKRRAAELAADTSDRQMREANRLLGMAERAAQVGHWRLDIAADTLFWSPEVFRIHGLAGSSSRGLADAIDFYHPDDRDRIAALVARSIEAGEAFDFEARIVRPDGDVRYVASRGQPEIGYDGATTALFGVLQDVSRRIEAEQALEAARAAAEAAAARAIRLADTDSLTGLASRRRSLAVLDQAVATGEPLALAIFDIDHFKSVNDRFGHPAGDAVLRRVARAASHAVRPTDMVGRLGGEEFVVILPGANAATALAVAETLRRAIATSADGIETGPPVTASLGVATLVPGGSAASLLGEADRALYEAKNAGRNAARLAA